MELTNQTDEETITERRRNGSIQSFLHECIAAKELVGFTADELEVETETDKLMKRIVVHLNAVNEMGADCRYSDVVLFNYTEFCTLATLLQAVPTIDFINAIVKCNHVTPIGHHFGLLSMLVMLATFTQSGAIPILAWHRAVVLWGSITEYARQPIRDESMQRDWNIAAAHFRRLLAKDIAVASVGDVGAFRAQTGYVEQSARKVVVIGSSPVLPLYDKDMHFTLTDACRAAGKVHHRDLLEPTIRQKPFWVQRQEQKSRRSHRR